MENKENEEKLKNFICKICYELVNEPIVTLCGHLYCWNCIYLWYKEKNKNIIPCPLCNCEVDIHKVIPLYVSWDEHKKKTNVPKRPKPNNRFFNNNNANPNNNANLYINIMGFNFNINLNNFNRNRYSALFPIPIFVIIFFFLYFTNLFIDNYFNNHSYKYINNAYNNKQINNISNQGYWDDNYIYDIIESYIPILLFFIIILIFSIWKFIKDKIIVLRQRLFN